MNELQRQLRSARRPASAAQGFRDGARLRGLPPVLAALVAARPHDRLGGQLRPRAPPPARRASRTTRRSARAARRSRTATAAPRSATRSCARTRPASGRRSRTGRCERPTAVGHSTSPAGVSSSPARPRASARRRRSPSRGRRRRRVHLPERGRRSGEDRRGDPRPRGARRSSSRATRATRCTSQELADRVVVGAGAGSTSGSTTRRR